MIFNSPSHPSEVTAMRAATVFVILSGVIVMFIGTNTSAVIVLDSGVDMLFKVDIVVVTVEGIGSEFVGDAMHFVVALADTTLGDETDVGADMDSHGLAAVITALEFEL